MHVSVLQFNTFAARGSTGWKMQTALLSSLLLMPGNLALPNIAMAARTMYMWWSGRQETCSRSGRAYSRPPRSSTSSRGKS